MADVTGDIFTFTPAVITGTSGAVADTISKSLTFVNLSTGNVTLTLPSAAAGKFCKVVVSGHPSVALTSGVVHVIPGSGDTINGLTVAATVWELNGSLTFCAVDTADWRITDVL